MKRGPKPKPAALKQLAGNPGKRPAQTSGGRTRVRYGRPDRPPELSAEAAAEWDRVAGELDDAGALALVDRAALAAYCLAWAELVAATRLLDAEGRIITEPIQSARGDHIGERRKAHPACRLQADAFARVKAFVTEFGLTPAARERLGGGPPDAGAPAGNKVLEIRARVEAAREQGGAG